MPRNTRNDKKHPYLRAVFFQRPENQFWESPKHTEKSREYFRNANFEVKK